jgi:DUF4097 and DUF4098 domain-containing protein YvlB
MPAFDTPEPISVTIALGLGNVRINASDRTDTVVHVRPSDESDDKDVRAAQQTRVEFSGGHLLVKAPKKTSWFGSGGSIAVTVDLPAGSRVDAETASDIRGEGRLGDSAFKTASGDIRLDQTGRLRLMTAHGDVMVTRSAGHTEVTATNGEVRIREIDGTAVIRNSNGDITLGEVTGDLRLSTAYGDITVQRALAGVDARTATGGIRIGEAVRGLITLKTAYGGLDVGIRQGTAVWLDVDTTYGKVRNLLEGVDSPRPSDETAEVRATTSYGDIVIHRS